MHTSHFIRSTDIHTAYHETGEGFPFILVHGYTGSKLDFHDQLSACGEQRRAIALDQRGHGESTNQAPYTLAQLTADLVGFLDQMGIGSCDLLGHSMGGMVALRVALHAPERVRSLVLMNTTAEPIADLAGRGMQSVMAQVQREGCESLLSLMRGVPLSDAVRRGIDALGEGEHWRRIGVKLAQMDPHAFVSLHSEMMHSESLVPRLADIVCPTTVVVGECDAAFRQPSIQLAKTIHNAHLVSIPAAGHSPQYEARDAWQHAIENHLNTVNS